MHCLDQRFVMQCPALHASAAGGHLQCTCPSVALLLLQSLAECTWDTAVCVHFAAAAWDCQNDVFTQKTHAHVTAFRPLGCRTHTCHYIHGRLELASCSKAGQQLLLPCAVSLKNLLPRRALAGVLAGRAGRTALISRASLGGLQGICQHEQAIPAENACCCVLGKHLHEDD